VVCGHPTLDEGGSVVEEYKLDKKCECCGCLCGDRYIITDEEDKPILDKDGNKQYLCCEDAK